MSYFTGIDIGSTASKVVVLDEARLVDAFVLPTGWSGKETAAGVAERLAAQGRPVGEDMRVVATGYGRVSVDYAAKTVTETHLPRKRRICPAGAGLHSSGYRRPGHQGDHRGGRHGLQLFDERQVLGGDR